MRPALLVLLLIFFAGIGVAQFLKPGWFVKRSGIRKGGDMLTEYNRAGFQIAGALFAAGALYMLYSLFRP
jgi:hypothetical protein